MLVLIVVLTLFIPRIPAALVVNAITPAALLPVVAREHLNSLDGMGGSS